MKEKDRSALSLACGRVFTSLQTCFGFESNKSRKLTKISDDQPCETINKRESDVQASDDILNSTSKLFQKVFHPIEELHNERSPPDIDGRSRSSCSQSSQGNLCSAIHTPAELSPFNVPQDTLKKNLSRDAECDHVSTSSTLSRGSLKKMKERQNQGSEQNVEPRVISILTISGNHSRSTNNLNEIGAEELALPSESKNTDYSITLPHTDNFQNGLLINERSFEDLHHSRENSNSRSFQTEDKSPDQIDKEILASPDIEYFRNLVSLETKRLNENIEEWNKVLQRRTVSRCPLEVCGDIRSVIGQTNLVINERFAQFSNLIEQADDVSGQNDGTRLVLASDLQGFWDMINFQIQDVDKKFATLTKLQANQWKTDAPSSAAKGKINTKAASAFEASQPAKKLKTKKTTQGDKKRSEDARRRLAEARSAIVQRSPVSQDKTPPPIPVVHSSITHGSKNESYSPKNDHEVENHALKQWSDCKTEAARQVGMQRLETSRLARLPSSSLVL